LSRKILILRRWWKSCCIKMADNEWSAFQLNSVHCYSNSRMAYRILEHTEGDRGVKNAFRWASFYMEVYHSKIFSQFCDDRGTFIYGSMREFKNRSQSRSLCNV
jgi:hypothetical protein